MLERKEYKYANVDTLSDNQTTELQVLFVGFKKYINDFTKDVFSGEPLTPWEIILMQEKLAEMSICLNDVLDNVVKVDENITVDNKSIVVSLSSNNYETTDKWGKDA